MIVDTIINIVHPIIAERDEAVELLRSYPKGKGDWEKEVSEFLTRYDSEPSDAHEPWE
jgi:hypothetical protein